MLPGLSLGIIGDGPVYATDFDEYATGSLPSDWTLRSAAGTFSLTVEEIPGSLSGKGLRWLKVASGRQAISWDRAPPLADAEILFRARCIEPPSGTANIVGGLLRGAGDANTGIRLAVSAANSGTRWSYQMNQYNNGSVNNLIGVTPLPSPAYTANTWFWTRFRTVGSLAQGRIWRHGEDEPVSWTASATIPNVHSAGFSGLQQVSPDMDVEVDFFAVSLDASTIPAPEI